MGNWLYTIEYYNDRGDKVRDYVLAKDKQHAMEKFAKHHPGFDDYAHFVNWKRIDY